MSLKLPCYHYGRWTQELPAVDKEHWCDFRREFEAGMTLKEIGEKYCCDPRTVRRCIFENRSSSDLGKQMAPRKLDPYIPRIHEILESDEDMERQAIGITAMGRKIREELLLAGFSGSERTVRNYLNEYYAEKETRK